MTTARFDVLGIGNAIVDILARTEDDFLVREKLAKGSMRLIDEAEAERLYGLMGPAIEASGGSAANTIAGLASFGGRAAYVGKIRDDQLGRSFAHDIRAIGVAFGTPPATDGPATARSFILVTPDGERTMNTYLGACQNLSPDDIDEAEVEAAEVTYLEGYLWDPPAAKAAFRKAADVAHRAGRRVALTLSDTFCVDRYRPEFVELLRGRAVDVLFANEGELKALYETSDFPSALEALRADAALGVVTRSAKGCVVVEGRETIEVPAAPVETVVDTTGAGDLFAAGFLFGLTKGLPHRRSGELGCMAAAEVIQQIGPRPQRSLKALAQERGLV
jgi:sugar/nucleoside kinase (ribokinase family)